MRSGIFLPWLRSCFRLRRMDGIPETMPFMQFRKEFPEAEFNLAHKKHEISVPGNFLHDAPWCSDSILTYQFEVKEGVVTRGGRRMSIVCLWVPKGPFYYFGSSAEFVLRTVGGLKCVGGLMLAPRHRQAA